MKQTILLVLVCTLIIKSVSAQSPVVNSYPTANRYDMNINDARKHIGEYKIAKGTVYKVEIRHNKLNPDSASVLFYLRDTKHPSSYLINIFRVNIKGNTQQANWYKNIKAGEVKFSKKISDDYDWEAEGRIFIFEGTPAIIMNFNDIRILEPVED